MPVHKHDDKHHGLLSTPEENSSEDPQGENHIIASSAQSPGADCKGNKKRGFLGRILRCFKIEKVNNHTSRDPMGISLKHSYQMTASKAVTKCFYPDIGSS
jgi:hypothetical protein